MVTISVATARRAQGYASEPAIARLTGAALQ
jgi:hypothetical protein